MQSSLQYGPLCIPVPIGLKVSENAEGKRINESIKYKNQSLQLFENRIKPNQHQLIMKNTKQPNPRRQNGLFRGALYRVLFRSVQL